MLEFLDSPELGVGKSRVSSVKMSIVETVISIKQKWVNKRQAE